jgi:hypothetical protein
MPLFDVLLTAELEGATRLTISPGFAWRLRFTCQKCREATDKFLVFTADDVHDMPGGRGAANLVATCKHCKAPFSADVVKPPGSARAAAAEYTTSGKPARICRLEARGAAPTEAQLSPEGVTVTGPSGATWDDVDIGGEDGWCEYDEAAGESVTVSAAALTVVPATGK